MAVLLRLHPMDLYPHVEAAPGACLLLLSSPACGACRAMRRALEEVEVPELQLRVLEVDAGASRGLVEEHGAFHLPALHLYTGGDYHGEVQAPPVPGLLVEAIRAVAQGPRGELP